jgi:3',5'-cyclic AMP phosphodiesterase CpdA
MTERIRIYWMTDLHLKDDVIGRPEAEDAIRRERHYYAAKDKLWQAVSMINRDKPDCVICTGDMNDAVQPYDTFTEAWDRVPEPKAITLGNHDLGSEYSAIVEQLGYRDRPVVAGSHFNRAFVLQKGEAQARVIVLDTNIGQDGRHRSNVEGTIQDDAFRWLEDEMRRRNFSTSSTLSASWTLPRGWRRRSRGRIFTIWRVTTTFTRQPS